MAAQDITNTNRFINEIINIAEMLTDVDIALYESQKADFVQTQGNHANTIQSMILTHG